MTGVQHVAVSPRFDYGELGRRPTHAEVGEYRRFAKRSRPEAFIPLRTRVGSVLGVLVGAALIALVAYLSLLFVWLLADNRIAPDSAAGGIRHEVSVIAIGAVFLCLAFVAIRAIVRMIVRDTRLSNRWRRRLRLERFAEANGGSYEPGGLVPAFTGTLVDFDSAARARDVLVFSDFEVGTARVTTGLSAVRRIGREWGFLRVRLERPVPHILLVSVRSRRTHPRRSSRISYAEAQRLGLEGDFGRHFTVYAPDGYGADTLYVLTPDLMALLVDEASDCDIDLVDDWLVISAPRPFDVADRATLERIGALVDRVAAAAVRRTSRYADGRPGAVPRVLVAQGGRRLRTRVPMRAIVPVVVLALLVVRHVLFDVIGLGS
jgi:hypothetical protein